MTATCQHGSGWSPCRRGASTGWGTVSTGWWTDAPRSGVVVQWLVQSGEGLVTIDYHSRPIPVRFLTTGGFLDVSPGP